MVVELSLTIKTIRGEEFTVVIDRQGDVLGLKLEIWNQRQVPIENQRLIFAGKELADNAQLVGAGIGHNATLFLVETAADEPAPEPAYIQQPAQNPSYSSPNSASVPLVQHPVAVVVPHAAINSQPSQPQLVGFMPVDPELLAAEQVNAVVDLGKWIRRYAKLAAFLYLLSVAAAPPFASFALLIPMFICLLGAKGTGNLCRCQMGIFAAFVFITALKMVGGSIFWIVKTHHYWPLIFTILGVLHFCIFACIVQHMRKVGKLSSDQKTQVRERMTKRCCH